MQNEKVFLRFQLVYSGMAGRKLRETPRLPGRLMSEVAEGLSPERVVVSCLRLLE